MELGLGLVPLGLDVLAVILAWAGMGSPWIKVCDTAITETFLRVTVCVRFKLFGDYGKQGSEVEATRAFVVIGMLLFVVAVIAGVLHLFTSQLSKNLTILGALGASIAAAACSILAVIIFGANVPEHANVDAGLILYIVCFVLGLASAIVWFVVKRKATTTANTTA